LLSAAQRHNACAQLGGAAQVEGRGVSPPVNKDNNEPSVLCDFDAGNVLDALSLAVIVLDEQLYAIYANVIARNLFALHLSGMRGRPLAHFLPQPERFACAVRRALTSKVAVDFTLGIGLGPCNENAAAVHVRIAPLSNQMSGAYVLVEMSARTCLHYQSPEVP